MACAVVDERLASRLGVDGGITSYAAVGRGRSALLPLIPQASHMALRRLAGRYEWVVVRFGPGAGQDDVSRPESRDRAA